MDKILGAIGVTGEEIDFVAVGGFDVGNLGMAALKLDEYSGLEGVAGVRLSAAIKYRDQCRIGRVYLARIDLAAFLRIGRDGDGVEKESILQMSEEFIKMIPRDRDSLGFQIRGELGDREEAGGAAQQAADQPAESRRVCDPVPLDHIAKEQDIDVTL